MDQCEGPGWGPYTLHCFTYYAPHYNSSTLIRNIIKPNLMSCRRRVRRDTVREFDWDQVCVLRLRVIRVIV